MVNKRIILLIILLAVIAGGVVIWDVNKDWLYPIVHSTTQSLLYPYVGVVLGAVLGAGLTLLANWYSRMFDRQDERRRRVYAPLFDELERLKKLLEGFHAIPPAARGYGELKEYEKIVDDHILFLVPKKLRADIRRLYDDLLKQFDKQLKLAKDKLEDSVLNDLVASGPAGAGIDSRAKQLGMMGRFVLSKQLPKEDWKPKMDAAFQDLKASGWKRLGSYASLDEMFEDQIARCDTNPIQEIVTLREIRTKCVDLLGRIRKEIGKDLGVE